MQHLGGPATVLTDAEVRSFVAEVLGTAPLDGRSVCLIVPDATRSCPLPLLLRAVHEALLGRASRVTVLIALGTHAPMSAQAIDTHLGYRHDDLTVLNHAWDDPAALVSVGTIPAARIAELSEGRIDGDLDVRINRAVLEHDVTLILGPVFPHEVVGFSGGTKYLFPGVSGQEVIDVSHWLGALLTSAAIIGTRGTTPVRALIDSAAALVPRPTYALCVVVAAGGAGVHSLSFGDPREAWAAAADVSAVTHVRYLDAPVRRVVSLIPTRYDDMWTAAKGFYKVEPVVADGGEVILYAPHVTQLAATHPEIADVGYHCRDYFVGQWDRFSGVHWGVLAHSTHLRGAGTWNPVDGERCRVTVTLATGIPEAVVRAANLAHLDPALVDLPALQADPDTLVVPNAGETLYRLSWSGVARAGPKRALAMPHPTLPASNSTPAAVSRTRPTVNSPRGVEPNPSLWDSKVAAKPPAAHSAPIASSQPQ